MVNRVLAGHPSYLSTYGFGPRKALLLHCSLAHGGVYSKLGAAIGGALSVTSFDQPGHGRAADWEHDGDLQDRVVEMALDLLTEPMDVIGHSFGGAVAVRLAVERPEMVRTLSLIEPVMLAIAKIDNPGVAAEAEQKMVPFYDALARGERDLAAELFTRTYGDGRSWSTLSAQTRAAIAARIHMIGAGNRGAEHDPYNLILSGKLEQITTPTLILDGGGKGTSMESVCDGLARRIPNATRVCIPDGGHMVPLTRPNAVAREILELVSRSQG